MNLLTLPHQLPPGAYAAAQRAVDLAYWDDQIDELTAIVCAVDPISRADEVERTLKIVHRAMEKDSCREGMLMLVALLEARRAELATRA